MQDLRREEQPRRSRDEQSYDPNSTIRVVGNGALTPAQQQRMTEEERNNFRDQVERDAP
jgi:hypothetical protein